MPSRRVRSRPRRRRSSRSRAPSKRYSRCRRQYRSASAIARARLGRRDTNGRTEPGTSPHSNKENRTLPNSQVPFPESSKLIKRHPHVIRPSVESAVENNSLVYRRISWDIVEVTFGGQIAFHVNTFLKSIQEYENISSIPVSKEQVVDFAVFGFTPSRPLNPGVYTMEVDSQIGEQFVNRFNSRNPEEFHAHRVDDETTRATIWDTLNKNSQKSILFLYSGGYPQDLFNGIQGIRGFPYAGS